MIEPVTTPQDLRAFIELPYRLYKSDSNWVAPLRSEQAAQFDPCKNPMLNHCEVQLFIARQGSAVVGRVSAFIDRLALEHWQEPVGLFGSFECIADPAVGQRLLAAAGDWLRARGMRALRGPWSFASQEWGLVVEGFSPPPVLMAPYNPPYYNDYLTGFGLEKAKDLLVYYIDGKEGYRIPERYLTLTDRVQKRYGVTVRPVDMNHLEEDVLTIVRLANCSIADNWGFYPVTEEEGRVMAHDLKAIVNPRALLIAEGPANGSGRREPVGFAMSLPDINLILRGLNGRLLPFGWLKLLWGLPRLRQYRMWALGVIPAYQGKAIDTLLYQATHAALFHGNVRLEINYVLEDNDRMNNALVRLGVKPLRRYRVYQKEL